LNDERGYFPMPTDRRHQIAFFTEDYMERYKNSKMHMRIVIGTGFPYTPYSYNYDDSTEKLLLMMAPQNSTRLPFYSRFDIGYTQEFKLFNKYRIIFREEILNLFNNFNVLSIEKTPWNKPIKYSLSGRVFNLGIMAEF